MRDTCRRALFCAAALAMGVCAKEPVRFTVTNRQGAVKLWHKDANQWSALSGDVSLEKGRTIMTESGGAITFMFEPAISVTLGENGIMSIDNLARNREGKTIRMLLTLQRGEADIRVMSASPYMLLLTLQTSAGAIDIRDADIAASSDKDGVSLRVNRGEARVRHNLNDVRVVVHEGSEATISQLKPQVSVAPDPSRPAPRRGATSVAPSVAILSMQSSEQRRGDMERFSEYIAEQFERTSKARVLFLDEIRTMLRNEDLAAMLECRTDSCIARIAVVAGVDAVIFGDLGSIGDRHLLSLKMYHVVKDRTVGRVSVTARGDPGNILDSIPSAVAELSGQARAVGGATAASAPPAPAPASDGGPAAGTGAQSAPPAGMASIAAGAFVMGSRYGNGDIDEMPHRNIEMSGFCLDAHEVTRAQFERVMGYDPSSYRNCPDCPVDNVSWDEARRYCEKRGKRLPTEAQWEYACRAGARGLFSVGSSIGSAQANFDGRYPYGGATSGNLRGRPLPAGSFKPNAWGVYDMHGNVAEWTSDWYDPVYYGNSPNADPPGPESGNLRVVRGGSWGSSGFEIRCANRTAYNPSIKLTGIGFRCAADSCAAPAK